MKRFFLLLICLGLLLCGCAAAESDVDSTGVVKEIHDAQSASPDTIPENNAAEQMTAPPAEKPTEPSAAEKAQAYIDKLLAAELSSASAYIDVEELEQYPELPTGCEPVALTIALNALGYDLEKTEMAEKYLEYSDNFAIGYCGDPFSDDGAGIWPPGMILSVDNFVRGTGAKVCGCNTSKQPLENLCKLVDAGCPVIVWTTYYMNEPMYTDDAVEYDGEIYMWYDNEHCVVLYGYDKNAGTVDVSDPLRGKVTVDADEFERINSDIGGWSMALVDTTTL